MTGQRTDRLCGSVSQQEGARPALLPPGGMIVREKEPLNLEMPFGSLDGFITPVDRIFVRSHFPIPQIDLKMWRLKIEGEVETPFELTSDEVREMKSPTIPVTMECAGNGRVFLTPQASGTQWERGAVGNAEWTGMRLADVLRRAGLKDSVCEFIFEGADHGEIQEPPGPAGKIHYARSMPLKKANEDVLVAFKMNGDERTPAHGSPLRVIVPGWYGMASVKWLTRIIAGGNQHRWWRNMARHAFAGRTDPQRLAALGIQLAGCRQNPGRQRCWPGRRTRKVAPSRRRTTTPVIVTS